MLHSHRASPSPPVAAGPNETTCAEVPALLPLEALTTGDLPAGRQGEPMREYLEGALSCLFQHPIKRSLERCVGESALHLLMLVVRSKDPETRRAIDARR